MAITSYCLGEAHGGTGLFFEDRASFLEAILEAIDEAEKRGQEHFDLTIEETEI